MLLSLLLNKYVLAVTTGMDFNAPTMSKPLATLIGTRGETRKLALKGKFHMGGTDTLSFCPQSSILNPQPKP